MKGAVDLSRYQDEFRRPVCPALVVREARCHAITILFDPRSSASLIDTANRLLASTGNAAKPAA